MFFQQIFNKDKFQDESTCIADHINRNPSKKERLFGWLVVFGLNGPLRQYFRLYRAVCLGEVFCNLMKNKRAMMALGRSPEYHWNQII